MEDICIPEERRECILRHLINNSSHEYHSPETSHITNRETRVPTKEEFNISYPNIEKHMFNFINRVSSYNIRYPIPEIVVTILLQNKYWFNHETCNILKSPEDYVAFWDKINILSRMNLVHASVISLISGRSGREYCMSHGRNINISRTIPRYIKNRNNCAYLYLVEQNIITPDMNEFIQDMRNEKGTNESRMRKRVETMKSDDRLKRFLCDDDDYNMANKDLGETCKIRYMCYTAKEYHECLSESLKQS